MACSLGGFFCFDCNRHSLTKHSTRDLLMEFFVRAIPGAIIRKRLAPLVSFCGDPWGILLTYLCEALGYLTYL